MQKPPLNYLCWCSTYATGLEVLNLVWVFIYIHTLCMCTANALASLRVCAAWPELSLLDNVISTKISHTASFTYLFAFQCHLLITFVNSLDPDKARKDVRPDLDTNCLTLWWYSWKSFLKKLILKKISRWQKKHERFPSRQRVKKFFQEYNHSVKQFGSRSGWAGLI